MMKIFLLIIYLFFTSLVYAQDEKLSKVNHDDWEIPLYPKFDKKKRDILIISESSLYAVSLIGLNQLWYSDYKRSSFHFINDNKEWLQMDKFGHIAASYYSGVVGIKAYKWTGMKKNHAIWYGGLTGTFFLTIIEVLDGFSEAWGASYADLLANTSGSLMAIGQELQWGEQRIQLKYSYRPSRWANLNPEQLGESQIERALKDYNGQTYWLSFNLKSLLQIQSNLIPEYLSLSFGHSANKMTAPYQQINGVGQKWYPQRKRQYLLALDIDLNKIKTKSKLINNVLHTFGFLKFPMPTLEISNKKVYWHPLYY